jgi:hypothetical protein
LLFSAWTPPRIGKKPWMPPIPTTWLWEPLLCSSHGGLHLFCFLVQSKLDQVLICAWYYPHSWDELPQLQSEEQKVVGILKNVLGCWLSRN